MQAIRLTSEQVTGMPRANTPITTAMHAAEVVDMMLIIAAAALCLAWQPWSKYVAWFCTVLLVLLIVRLVRMRAHGGHPRGGKYFLDNF